MEILLNKKLIGELRTKDGPVEIICQWRVEEVFSNVELCEGIQDPVTETGFFV